MRDDLISRQAAIDTYLETVEPIAVQEWDGEITACARDRDILEMLENLPSVQPKAGHWICDYKGDHVADYHCSECGRQLGFAFSTQNKKILGGRWKYCDVCGAKMEEKTE